MAAQDDAREIELIHRFNLVRPPDRKRHGTDAILLIDGHELEFELKSVTKAKGSISTVRDFGPRHIEKWEYVRGDFDMAKLVPSLVTIETMYASIGQKNRYGYDDAVKLHKDQMKKAEYLSRMDMEAPSSGRRGRKNPRDGGYSPERMLEIFRERVRYVIERGATLNNPHISYSYFDRWETITEDHATRLRELVRNWLASAPPQQILQDDRP